MPPQPLPRGCLADKDTVTRFVNRLRDAGFSVKGDVRDAIRV